MNSSSLKSDWPLVNWEIPLDMPPSVVLAGVGRHGFSGPERYHLRDVWSLHLYGYDARLHLNKTWFPIRPGFAGIIPPDMPIEYLYNGPSTHLFVHFRCEDLDNHSSANPPARIAAMQDLGIDFPRFSDQLEQVVRLAGASPYRLQARVWDILCDLAQRTEAAKANERAEHAAVAHVKAQIEIRLSEEISVAGLAREAGVSVGYLSKLFQQSESTTVVAYLRARRIRRAEHLLRHSTLPVKAIATAVGIPDLHLFNKTIRKELGASPRAVRTIR